MRACAMCHGTDVQEQCEDGQCYWEEMQRQERELEERMKWEAHEMEKHYERHPHG